MSLPSAYQLKKFALWPRTRWMRHRERHQQGFIKSALELHYYRPAYYEFIAATMMQPDLLTTADLGPGDIVFDVGAYTGEWATAMLDRYPVSVMAFEPNPLIYRQLQEKRPDYPGLQPLQYGLGGANETARISLKGMGSSIYAHAESDADPERVDVTIRAVDEVWRELGYQDVDLLKINIEGAEFPLLERMIETNLLSQVRCLMVQFHEWHPGAYGRRRAIRRALSKTHKMDWDYHFVWEKWTRKS